MSEGWMPANRNRAKCRICGDIIESKYQHDWIACKGGHIFIDGGRSYKRYGTLKEGVEFEDIIPIDDDGKEIDDYV